MAITIRTDGKPQTITVPAGSILSVTASAVGNGRVKRLPSLTPGAAPASTVPTPPFVAIAAGATRRFGPHPAQVWYSIETFADTLTYSIDEDSTGAGYCTLRGAVIDFTGNYTLTADDNGKLLRCEDGSNVTVTVPNSLADGFNVALAMWGTGTVTVSAGSGATKRGSPSALSTQYQAGSLIVMKNADGASAEFVLGGDFA